MKELVEDTIKIVNSLSEQKLREAHHFLSYLKDKDEWEATNELSNPEILEEIKQGINELKNGNYVKFDSIRRNV